MQTDLLAPPPEKSPTPDLSQDTLTQKTAENTTFALKVLPVSTDAQSELSSRSEILKVQATAKDPKMFPDGKFPDFELAAFPNPQNTNKNHQTVINQILRIARIHRCLIAFITSSHFHTSNHRTQHSHPPTEYHINIFSI